MMTLKEARRLQKERESKVLVKFFALSVAFGIFSFLLVHYSGIAEKSQSLYILPLAVVIYIGWKTGITAMFSPKEVLGEVIHINIYQVTSQRVKGERSYVRNYALEAEITITTKNGKRFTKAFPNGDITERLCIGDEIAILRFFDEPVVIKGNYLK